MKIISLCMVLIVFSLSAMDNQPNIIASTTKPHGKGIREQLLSMIRSHNFRAWHKTVNNHPQTRGLKNFIANIPADRPSLSEDLIEASQFAINTAQKETTTLNNKTAITRCTVGGICVAVALAKLGYDIYDFVQNPDLNTLYLNLSMYASEVGLGAYGIRQIKLGVGNVDAHQKLANSLAIRTQLPIDQQNHLIEINHEDDKTLSLLTTSHNKVLAFTQQE